jgi:hypothetical protein
LPYFVIESFHCVTFFDLSGKLVLSQKKIHKCGA